MTLQARFGVDLSVRRQTNVRDLDLDTFTYVIAMDSVIAQSLANLTQRGIVTWDIDDPWGQDAVVYHHCALKIREQIEQFAKAIRLGNKRETKPVRMPR
jgi:protein-tyrosine-phosphatase